MNLCNPDLFENVVGPWFSDSTIEEDMESLSSVETLGEVELRNLIANWLVKYFYLYRNPTETSDSFYLNDLLHELTLLATSISGLVRKGQFSMGEMCLFDFAKTAALVEGLYKTRLAVEGIGLDLGTGTGVLAHAAKMALARNGIRQKVIGIDRDKFQLAQAKTRQTDDLTFLVGDSTTPEHWQDELDGQSLALVVNENLPNPGTRLFSELSGKEHEPFFTNLDGLERNKLLNPDTVHFPQQVDVARFHSNGNVCDEGLMSPLDESVRTQLKAWHEVEPATAITIARVQINGETKRLKTLGEYYLEYFPAELFRAKRW